MKAGSTRVVNADVGFQRATQSYFFTIQWNRDASNLRAEKTSAGRRSVECSPGPPL